MTLAIDLIQAYQAGQQARMHEFAMAQQQRQEQLDIENRQKTAAINLAARKYFLTGDDSELKTLSPETLQKIQEQQIDLATKKQAYEQAAAKGPLEHGAQDQEFQQKVLIGAAKQALLYPQSYESNRAKIVAKWPDLDKSLPPTVPSPDQLKQFIATGGGITVNVGDQSQKLDPTLVKEKQQTIDDTSEIRGLTSQLRDLNNQLGGVAREQGFADTVGDFVDAAKQRLGNNSPELARIIALNTKKEWLEGKLNEALRNRELAKGGGRNMDDINKRLEPLLLNKGSLLGIPVKDTASQYSGKLDMIDQIYGQEGQQALNLLQDKHALENRATDATPRTPQEKKYLDLIHSGMSPEQARREAQVH